MTKKSAQKTRNNNAALITGGAKRIGREIAIFLASRGYDLLISYNNSKKEAEKLASEIAKKYQVKVEIFKCDLSDTNQAKKLINFAKINFKNLNLLINNASIFNKSKFLGAAENELLDNLNIHLISPLILSKEFAKFANKKDAQIINMIDKNIVRFDTSYFYYLLSKKSLADATKMLALELAPSIRVNGIAPGFIINPIDDGISQNETEKIIKKIPLAKKGDIKNIVQTVEFLLDNNFINGQIIFVDGGSSLNHAG